MHRVPTGDSDLHSRGNPAPQGTPGTAKELCLRFICGTCQHWLSAPLRQIGNHERCPGCQHELLVPTLEGYVIGLDDVLKSVPRPCPQCSVPCPECGAELQVPVDQLSRQQQCYHCDTPLRLRVVADPGFHPRSNGQPATEPQLAPRESRPAEAPYAQAPPHHHSTHSAPPVAQRRAGPTPSERNHDQESDHLLRSSPYAHQRPAATSSTNAVPELPVIAAPTTGSARSTSAGLRITPRYLRYVVFFGIWLGPIALALGALLASGEFAPLLLAIPWWFIGPLFAKHLTPPLMAALVSVLRCPGCQEELPTVNRWYCSCGYHDHTERNVFLFHCPRCGNRIGYTDCPQCESTILL